MEVAEAVATTEEDAAVAGTVAAGWDLSETTRVLGEADGDGGQTNGELGQP